MKRISAALAALSLVAVLFLTSCEKSKTPEQAQQGGGTAPAAEERVEKNPDRNAYFGEEHIHTSWSVDAWLMGNRLHRPRRCLQVRAGADHQAPAWV
jgi:hypothetical protein